MIAARLRHRLALAGAALLPLLLPAAAPALGVDGLVPLNGTASGEVPDDGSATTTGILLPAGLAKGSLQVKAAKGTGLLPKVSLVWPDGTVRGTDALAALGAKVKVKGSAVTVSKLPTLEESGLYRVIVAGAEEDGEPTGGGFTLRMKGKPSKGFKGPLATIGTQNEKDDYLLSSPENGLLSLKLKPAKGSFFAPSLAILTGSGDALLFDDFAKIGKDDSISIKNFPLPFFGDYTLRVGSKAGTGDYTLAAKVKGSKAGPPSGAPVADAGDGLLVEPGGQGALDASGTSGAASVQWSRVGGPSASLSSTSALKPVLTAPANRASIVFQVVGRNAAGTSAPALAVVEVDRTPVADAGPSVHLAVPAQVTLDGSRSYDPDPGDTLTFAWMQVSGPAVTLTDAFSSGPSFTPGADGLYAFDLVVNDGTADSSPSRVLVGVGAAAPVADAGRIIRVRPHETVFLSGLRSRSGSGGTPQTFAWTAGAGNPVAVTLAGASGPVASFTAPKQTAHLLFKLTVDGSAAAADEVRVFVSSSNPVNNSPVAAAGSAQAVGVGVPFVLDGSASTDDGSIQEYSWMQVSGAGSGLLDGGMTASGTAPGTDDVATFLLMTWDGAKYGPPDSVAVVAGTRVLPVAGAGGNLSGDPLANLVLSSASSQASSGQAISSRQWTQLSGKDWYDIAAKDGGFVPTAVSPVVRVPDTVSSLTPRRTILMGLVVTDPAGSSAADHVTLVFTNLPTNATPVVQASSGAVVYRPGASVVMTAVASDPDLDAITYSWAQVEGTTALITNPTSAVATVTAPTASGTLKFRVTVNDGTGEPNATSTADVTFSVNRPPVIVLSSTPASGPATTVVSLSGVGTTDPDDGSLAYAWTEIPPVVGSPVTLSGASTDTASFTQPAYTGSVTQRRRTFRLTVTDSMGAAFAVEKTVTFTPNAKPLLNDILAAGDRKIFYSNSLATSDRSESFTAGPGTDADGDLLTFSWSIQSGPLTTASLLSASSGATVSFGAPKPTASQANTGGVYVIAVVASDGIELSGEKTVPVVVTASFAADIYPLVSGSCNTSSCHGGSGQGGLVMTGGAQNALYGNGSYSSPSSASLLASRVVANDYANSGSKFWGKLNDGSMPKNQAKWSAHLINMVRDWIEPEHNVSTKPGLSTGAEDN